MAKQNNPAIYRHSVEAERAVLGSMLNFPECIDGVLEVINPADFYLQSHRLICEAIATLHSSHEPIDNITVCHQLKQEGNIEQVGGVIAVISLEGFPVGLMSHVKIISDCAQARKVLDLAKELTEASKTATPKDLHEQALKLAQAAEPRRVRRPDVGAKELIAAFADKVDKPALVPTRPPIPTPWPALTAMLNGGWTGGKRPYYIGARRKVGKTSAALEIAVDAATTRDVNTVLFELELDMDELLSRMVAAYSEIPHRVIESRSFDAQQAQQYIQALERCYTDRLRIDASRFDRQGGKMDRIRGSRTIEGIRRTLNRILLDQDVGLIVVDHLQKIEPPFPCPIFERVTQASNGLAEIAQEFGIPVVAMLQLNEGKEAPTATDTRGGQEIGNDCQALILLDRPPMRRAQKEQDRMDQYEKEEAELIVALHGSGATGTIPMRYAGAHMRWYQAAAPDWLTATRMAAR